MNELINNLIEFTFAKELIIVIVSAIPIIELRGALPIAINLFGIPWYLALPLCLIGNFLPVPIILWLFNLLVNLISTTKIGAKFSNWLIKKIKQRGRIIEKYERIGLALFVAIPLPFTGAWSGAIAASIFGIKFGQALLAIFCGLVIAGTIVTCLCIIGWAGALIAGILLSLLAVLGLWKL